MTSMYMFFIVEFSPLAVSILSRYFAILNNGYVSGGLIEFSL